MQKNASKKKALLTVKPFEAKQFKTLHDGGLLK